jgi:hypothetical protein
MPVGAYLITGRVLTIDSKIREFRSYVGTPGSHQKGSPTVRRVEADLRLWRLNFHQTDHCRDGCAFKIEIVPGRIHATEVSCFPLLR